MTWTDLFNPLWWTNDPVGLAHFSAAIIALVIGPISFFRRKGDRAHRWLGWTYVTVMALVNVSALTMYEMTGRPNLFHFFAVLSLVTVTPGIICAVRARRQRRPELIVAHYFFMSWSYFGLFAAFASQVGTQLGVRAWQVDNQGSVFLGVGLFTAALAFFAQRLINHHSKPVIRRFSSGDS